ncbi:MAG: type III pantothenate kinase [Myxococcota bacterium]
MLLAIDIGNTNLTLGLYDDERLVRQWRLETVPTRTEDEYGLLVHQLLDGPDHAASDVKGVIVASVVPILTATITSMVRRSFGLEAKVIGPGLKTGIPILYNPPKDVGADRIVNAVAAYHRFKCACIVVDFGTATTFDSISAKGEYAGGAIAAGIQISMTALFRNAAKLPKVDITRPTHVVGKSTVESIQSGLYFGYVSLVDGLVERMKAEMNANPIRVIATGGLAPTISEDAKCIETVDETLTLDGLRLVYSLNSTP